MSSTPSYQHNEEFQNRSQKLKEIRSLGIEPYPHHYSPSHEIQEILQEYHDKQIGDSEQAGVGNTPFICIAGRLVLFRAMGKNAFAHIQDGGDKLQIMFNKDLTQVEGFHSTEDLSSLKFIEKKIDLGDHLGIEGHLFRTHKGEITLFAKKVTLLCKSE